MKTYGVICIPNPPTNEEPMGVTVNANDPAEAEQEALLEMRKQGHANAIIAPSIPNTNIVKELKKLRRTMRF